MIYVILGFLMMKALTKYDIKNLLDRDISPFYAASYGSINHAIKKLLDLGYVEFTEVTTDGRHKKVYAIKPSGQEAFMVWLKEDIAFGKHSDDLSLKLFFYGFLTLKERIERLETYYMKQQEHYQAYSSFYKEVSKGTYPKEVADIATCQIMTLDYATHQLACDLEWLAAVLKRLKEEANASNQ